MPAKILMLAGIASACLALADAADAKQARCFSTDDGEYSCDFKATDADGSFEIAAPGKPTFILIMDEPGVASAFANFGDRNVSLPGLYLRDASDPACWISDATAARICAW